MLPAPREPSAGLPRPPVSQRSASPESSAATYRLWWRRAAVLPALALLLALAMILAGAVGEVPIPPSHAAEIVLNQIQILHWHVFHFQRSWPVTDEVILLQLRLPRVAGAALVGLGLAVSGTLFQGLLRNPLADPLLLGTSSGAALGASIAFVVPALFTADWLGFGLIPALAFAGAVLAVALVYSLASRGGQTPVVTLLLAGVAVSAVLTALQTLIITRNDRLGLQISSLYLWLAGGVDVQTWQQVGVILAIMLVGVAAAVALAPVLDAFALGEEMASHLGLSVERSKLAIVGAAALLVAAAVSISGLVGFVGLVAPHVCRIALGPRHRLLVPAAGLAGAIFVVVADLLARTLAAPSEIPLGVVTALVGGPFFLWLLRYAGRQYSW
jgi:iron complex transport system permease protein